MAWSHRDLEGLLYGLGSPPDVTLAVPRLTTTPQQRVPPGPRDVPRPLMRRLEVGVQFSRLSAADRQVLEDHYLTGRQRHPYRRRKPIIGALLMELNREP